MRKPKKELSEEEQLSAMLMMIMLVIIAYLYPVMKEANPSDIIDGIVQKRMPIPTLGGKVSNKQHREKRKMIQVPVDTELLTALDRLSIKQRKTLSEVIRQACRRFIMGVKSEYKEGYEKLPEGPDEAIVQTTLTSEILSKDPW